MVSQLMLLLFESLRTGRGYSGEQRLHKRLSQAGLSLPCKVEEVGIPICIEDDDGEDKVEIVQWPVLLPHVLVEALAKEGLSHTMLGSRSDHTKYWTSMSHDFPNHQVADPQYTIPLVLYGDEATVFRQACMCVHFHPLLCKNKTNATLSRYLIALVPSENYWVVLGSNVEYFQLSGLHALFL